MSDEGRPIRHTEHPRGTVLVVDDSRVVRRMIGDILRLSGFAVDEAENGRGALQRLDAHDYDVVLTDLRMPELDGFALLEAIKRRGLATEVIIVTGSFGQDVSCAIRALRLGAHDYMVKPPARPEEVVLTVERALEKRRLKEANARLLKQLHNMSRTDALTGALNRRAFDETLAREQARAGRYGLPLALLLFDMDHFKQVNDTFGHAGGDEALKAFVKRAQALFRDSDSVFRFGGEEFAVLLPHTDAEGGRRAAERMLAALAHTHILAAGSSLRVTASAGVASATGGDLDGLDLVTLADGALYQAKRAGRNRAACAPPSAAPAKRGVRLAG